MNEIELNINGELHAFLTLPDDISQPKPALLLVHGFASNTNEVANFYRKLANNAAARGIVILRFDFSGCGESAGKFCDITLEQQIQNTISAYKYLSAHELVDQKRIAICGFSLGTISTICTAVDIPNAFKTMILLSPAGDLLNDFRDVFGEQANLVDHALQSDNHELILIDYFVDGQPTVLKLKAGFFHSLAKFNPKSDILNFAGPLLCIAGADDFSAKHAGDYCAVRANQNDKLQILDATNHIFNAFSGESSKLSDVINQIGAWLDLELLDNQELSIKATNYV